VVGVPESLGPGLWRSRALGRLIFWVSSRRLPVEADSLPLHLATREPSASARAVADLVLEQPQLQARYAGWMASLHPTVWKEVQAMARTTRKELTIDFRPAIEVLGLDYVLNQVGIKEVVKHIGVDRILASLSAAERRELKRRLLHRKADGED